MEATNPYRGGATRYLTGARAVPRELDSAESLDRADMPPATLCGFCWRKLGQNARQ